MKIRTNNKAGQYSGAMDPRASQYPYQSPGDAMIPLQRPSNSATSHYFWLLSPSAPSQPGSGRKI